MELWCHEIEIIIHINNLDTGSTWFQAIIHREGHNMRRSSRNWYTWPEGTDHWVTESFTGKKPAKHFKESRNDYTRKWVKSLIHEINIIFTQKTRFIPKHIILTANTIQTRGVLASKEVNQKITHSLSNSFRYQPQCELKTWWRWTFKDPFSILRD